MFKYTCTHTKTLKDGSVLPLEIERKKMRTSIRANNQFLFVKILNKLMRENKKKLSVSVLCIYEA